MWYGTLRDSADMRTYIHMHTYNTTLLPVVARARLFLVSNQTLSSYFVQKHGLVELGGKLWATPREIVGTYSVYEWVCICTYICTSCESLRTSVRRGLLYLKQTCGI